MWTHVFSRVCTRKWSCGVMAAAVFRLEEPQACLLLQLQRCAFPPVVHEGSDLFLHVLHKTVFLMLVILSACGLVSFFWLRWVFIAACGFSPLAESRGSSFCMVQASHCGGFSCFRAQALECGPIIVVHGLSCSTARGIFPDQGSNLYPAWSG